MGQENLLIDALAPHASGVSLSEITKITRIDQRASHGTLHVEVQLKTLDSSGIALEVLNILEGYSGGGQLPDEKPPRTILPPESLKVGQRCWFAFFVSGAEVGYTSTNPDGLLRAWKIEDEQAAQACRQALDRDHFKWQPRFDPDIGLTCEHLVDGACWTIRVSRDGQVLWQAELSGKRSQRKLAFGFWKAGYTKISGEMPACGKLLIAESVTTLHDDNEYEVEPGTYSVATAYDPESGARRATWISLAQDSHVDVLQRYYSESSTLRRDVRYERSDDNWFKRESSYDESGRRIRTITFKHDALSNQWIETREP